VRSPRAKGLLNTLLNDRGRQEGVGTSTRHRDYGVRGSAGGKWKAAPFVGSSDVGGDRRVKRIEGLEPSPSAGRLVELRLQCVL